jgi:hypothetical protein
MTTEQPGYLAYLLRLWRVNDDGKPVWRASLESPHTGERHGFANLECCSRSWRKRREGLRPKRNLERDLGHRRKEVEHKTQTVRRKEYPSILAGFDSLHWKLQWLPKEPQPCVEGVSLSGAMTRLGGGPTSRSTTGVSSTTRRRVACSAIL